MQQITFSNQHFNKKSILFRCVILDVMFLDFGKTWHQKLDFGSPLASSCEQNGTQNRPGGAKMRAESIHEASVKRNLGPICFRGRFRNAPGHHFD